jgi:hypothetical protein
MQPRCLLALRLAGDLGERGFCWQGVVGSRAWWSSLAAVERPRTAQGRPSLAALG